DIRPVKKQKESTWVEITMTEGQNREIRRLLARVGHKVMKLERIGFGPLRLGRVPLGEYRELRREELAELHSVLQRNRAGDQRTEERRADGARSTGQRPRKGRADQQGEGEQQTGKQRPGQQRMSKQQMVDPG